MKTLSQIVADLEYCKELEELGVKQKSLFYWYVVEGDNEAQVFRCNNSWFDGIPQPNTDFEFRYSAWTASELGEMLPWRIEVNGMPRYLTFGRSGSGTEWYVQYIGVGDSVDTVEKDLTNTMAKMLIYLLKNNIISLEEVNKNI